MQSSTRTLDPQPAKTSTGRTTTRTHGNPEPLDGAVDDAETLTPDPDLARFSQNLLRLRTAMKLSRPALAHQIGTSAKALEHWEDGTGNPPIRCIAELARFFGMTTDELLGYELDPRERRDRPSPPWIQMNERVDELFARMDAYEAERRGSGKHKG